MDRLKQLEYPLPVIKAGIDKIVIEASSSCEGSFVITNAGGSQLSGKITSNSRNIKFEPQTFSGNRTIIKYTFNFDSLKQGDEYRTTALIVSNGGEISLPIEVRITAPAIITKENEKIVTLNDYLNYVRKYPVPSRQLFTQTEFLEWLINTGYEHIEIYEQSKTERNKERAVDNFLVLNKLKKKSELIIRKEQIDVKLLPLETDVQTGEIEFEKSCWGFLEASIIKDPACTWLSFSDTEITGSAFDESNRLKINYFIDPKKIDRKILSEKIIVKGDEEHHFYINVVFLPPFTAKLNQKSYKQEDTAEIIISNYTGGDLMVAIDSPDVFIRCDAKKYYVQERGKIMLNIHVTMLAAAQYFLKKQTGMPASVTVSAIIEGRRYEEKLDFAITLVDLQ